MSTLCIIYKLGKITLIFTLEKKNVKNLFGRLLYATVRIYDKIVKLLSRSAEATERAGFVPQYGDINELLNEQHCHRRGLQRNARGTSASSGMAQRLAQSRYRRTGPSFCVPRRTRKCQRQRHRIHPGVTLT